MATLPEEQTPVAAVNPVATAPVQTTPAPVQNTAPAIPLFTTPTADQVYSPTNIQQIDIPSTKRASKMKLEDLEKKLSKANSIAELNQIGIMNQTKAMGVLTGEAAYRDKLDTARINAFNSLYNNRLLEEQRKEAERQQFISTYGADPKMRPSGMSKSQFAKALQAGQFSNLLTEDFKQKQLETASKRQSLANSSSSNQSNIVLADAGNALQNSKGEDGYVNPYEYIKQRNNYVRSVKGATPADFDAQYANMLNPNDRQSVGLSMSASSALAKSGGTLTTAVKTDLATMDTIKNMATSISSQDSLPGVGGLGYGTVAGFLAKNLGLGSEQGETNRNIISNIKATIAKLRGGTSFTPNEEKLLEAYTPTINDSDFVIKTKLQNLVNFIDEKKHQTLLQNGINDPSYGEQDVNDILNSL